MTRSELVEKGIELFNHAVAMTKDENAIYFGNEEMREINQFGLDLFLAEQKRAAGCVYCNSDMVDGYALENMNGKYPKIIGLARKNWRSGYQSKIRFCPNCGRDLTKGKSV